MNAPAQHAAQRRIQSLPLHLANQIAAGEVVERPASVVKELLENSIDAGARHIELEVEQGGTKLLRVLDDGVGIHPDDLSLSISPHATSKVYSQQELQQVLSLGFRGEALASIASVSRFSLASRQSEKEQGLRMEKGEIAPCAMPHGTRIEVRDIFYNTPARRKFLRTERTEFLHIEEVVKRLALSRFDVAFKLLHNGRQQFNLTPIDNAGQRDQRVAAVLGKGFVQQALSLEFEAAGMRLWGWVGRPGYSRSQTDAQYFYLNGRMIRDKLVNHALRQVHRSLLEQGRHAAYLLYLELDPQQVDVNVHPTKHEVRFRESRLVHDFLLHALNHALSERDGVPSQSQPIEKTQTTYRHEDSPSAQVAEQGGFYRPSLNNVESFSVVVRNHSITVAHGEYLIAQREGELGVLAITPARRLLLQRRLAACLESGEVQSQPLLIPVTVRLDGEKIKLIEQHAATLLRLGVMVERLGEMSVVLRQLSPLLRGVEAPTLVVTLADFLVAAPDVEREPMAYLQAFSAVVAPLLPPPDNKGGEALLRELEQLLIEGQVASVELPWRTLTAERLSALFADGTVS